MIKPTLKPFFSLVLFVTLIGSLGCTNYYVIKDPTTGNTYYTTKYKKKDGALNFETASGTQVTIQNAEISEITKKQYTAQSAP